MIGLPMQGVLESLRRVAATGLSDADLLERFVASRDETAFAELVRLHGPMVLGVCRRILKNQTDAEDAYQATFIVLARKAGSIRTRPLVGNWLYGVARNAALRAKGMIDKRRQKEREAAKTQPPGSPDQDLSGIQQALDDELGRLPEKYRSVLVLCEIEGRQVKEVADRMGLPQGTVASRLSRGRTLLGKRLRRRGVACSSAALAAMLSGGVAMAVVPPALTGSTVKVALSMAAGEAGATSLVTAQVLAIAEGVLKAMWMTKVKMGLGLVLAFAFLGTGAGVIAHRALARAQGEAVVVTVPVPDPVRAQVDKRPVVLGPVRFDLNKNQNGPPTFSAVAFSPDEKLLVSGDSTIAFDKDDRCVRLWEIATGKLLHTLGGGGSGASSVGFSPDGKYFAAVIDASEIDVRYVSTGKEFKGPGKPTRSSTCSNNLALAFSQDGKLLATVTPEAVFLLTVATGEVQALSFLERRKGNGPYCVLFSPDNKSLAWESSVHKGTDHAILLKDLTTGKLRRFEGHSAAVIALAFSADGKTLASVGRDQTIRWWEVATGKERHQCRFDGLMSEEDQGRWEGKRLCQLRQLGKIRPADCLPAEDSIQYKPANRNELGATAISTRLAFSAGFSATTQGAFLQ